MQKAQSESSEEHIFSGNIYIFHSFDVGDDIDLNLVQNKQLLTKQPYVGAKYFKNYHTPLAIDPPHPHATSHCESAILHNFGVITLRYKIPLTESLEKLREDINTIENEYKEQSVEDAAAIFKAIKTAVKQPHFFHIARSYVLIQVNTEEDIDILELKDQYAEMIAATLRFETETLSEYKKNQIIKSAFGYYHGDLIVIDTESAFIYDDEYEEVLDLFEFVNIQHLELQYFDRLLDQKLNAVYETEAQKLPWQAYLPIGGTLTSDLVKDLGKLRVDISVITERLESSIKLVGEPYYSELYTALIDKLDVTSWKASIQKKFEIIREMSDVYQSAIRTVRDDVFNVLIVLLIFMEFVVAIMHYFKA
jgi:uncharacterized Rmd1/YagE family protein